MERIILKASKGMILTDGSAYGTTVYLGEGRNPKEFYEITIEEYNKLIEEEVQSYE